MRPHVLVRGVLIWRKNISTALLKAKPPKQNVTFEGTVVI